MEKLLEDALIKMSSVVSDLHGVSGRAMMDALIAGERDPRALAAAGQGPAHARRPTGSKRRCAGSSPSTTRRSCR